MSERQFKMAIVGFGGMGNWHRELVESIDHLVVKGIYDISEERCQFAKNLGLIVYENLEEVCKDEEIDLVLCATPNQVHKDITIQCLKAGKYVLCEKPVALSSKEFEEMVAAEGKAKLFVHQNRRFDEDFLTIKKIIDENLLGEIHRIESRVHGSRGIPGDWRGIKEYGGGMLYDWGVHILDQAWMMIHEKIVSVYGTFQHVTNELVDDGFTVQLQYENGLVYLLEVGTSNFISLPRWYVLGQNGSAIIEDWELNGKIVRVTDWDKKDAIPVKTAAGLTKTMAPRTEDSIKEEPLPKVTSDIRDYYKNVMAVIDGKEEQLVSNKDVLEVLKLMEAIFQSAEKNQVIYLN